MEPTNRRGGMKEQRNLGLRSLHTSLVKITDKAIRKRGFIESGVVHQWDNIIGGDVAKWCWPAKLAFPRNSSLGATLYLDVLTARSLEVQHLEPIILEKINTVFGYRAVAKISIRQVADVIREESTNKSRRRLDPEEKKWISEQIEKTNNANLKKALETLGGAILSQK